MILAAHSKTAREMLYLALGVVPVRFILMSKRLNYLKYMLNEEDGTMLKDYLTAQHQSYSLQVSLIRLEELMLSKTLSVYFYTD